MASLSLSLFGTYQATLDGHPMAEVGSVKAHALLAYLAVESDHPHHRRALASLLWPDFPESRARANLSQALFLLRGALGDNLRSPTGAGSVPVPLLIVTAQTIRFNATTGSKVDVTCFTSSLDECARHPHSRLELCAVCMERLQQAVVLYQGRFLEDLSAGDSIPYEEWALLKQEQLHNQAIAALHSLAEGLAACGEYERALAYARRQVDLDPWREEAQRQVMWLLALSERRSEALVQYEACRRLLAEELAAKPSAETARLYEEIRTGVFRAPTVAATGRGEPEPPEVSLVDVPGIPSMQTRLFVAREKELAHLDGWLKQALAGQARIGFVVGESGSGKTLLLREFAQQAMERHPDLVVAGGTCNAYAGIGDSCLPFLEILRLLTGDVEARRAAGALSIEHARRLQAIAPETLEAVSQAGPALVDTLLSRAALLERARELPDGAAWEARVQEAISHRQGIPSQTFLFDQVARVLQALARNRPLLLMLDDLQWADATSISLLFHLGHWLMSPGQSGPRILILGAYRPEEVATGRGGEAHPLEGVLCELQALWEDISLDLRQAAGRAFVEALVGRLV